MNRFRLMPNYRYYKSEDAFSLTVTSPMNKSLRDFKIYGNSKQEIRSGKNLLDVNKVVNERQVSSLTSGSQYYAIQLKSNTSYTLTTNCYTDTLASFFLTLPNVVTSTVNNGVYSGATYRTATTDETGILWVWTRVINDGIAILDTSEFDNGTYWVQLEEGVAPTDYEPYGITPSPEFLSEVQGVGEKTKNLFDISNVITGHTVGNTGELVSNAIYSASDYIEVKPNTTYTFTIYNTVQFTDGSNSTVRGWLYTSDKTRISICYEFTRTEIGYNTATFTTTENTQYFRFGMRNTDTEIQLEEGVTSTEYEPYNKYKIPIKIRGKNLFDYSSTEPDGCYLINDGSIITTGNTNLRTTDYISIPNDTTALTFSYNGDSMKLPALCLYDEDKNYITGQSFDSRQVITIDVPSNAKYVRHSYRIVNSNIQLECGSTATEYEPYYKPVITNIYLDEPLRKIGNYADYIDFQNQRVVRNVQQYIFKGDEVCGYNGNKAAIYYLFSDIALSNGIFGSDKLVCNTYVTAVDYDADIYYGGKDNVFFYGIKNADRFVLRDTTHQTTLDEWKQWVAQQYNNNNPIKIYYVLENSREETITIPPIFIHKNVNIITTDTDIKSSKIEIQYYK